MSWCEPARLLELLPCMTGHESGACLCCRQGEAVRVYDGRPNGELVLATGALEDGNPADCQTVQVLVGSPLATWPCLSYVGSSNAVHCFPCPRLDGFCSLASIGLNGTQRHHGMTGEAPNVLSAGCEGVELVGFPMVHLLMGGCVGYLLQVGLVQADRLYTTKKQIVESVGLSAVQVRCTAIYHDQTYPP